MTLTSFSQVHSVSFSTNERGLVPKTMCHKNGHIAYCDEDRNVFVTPFRQEIPAILAESGYKEFIFTVPFSNGEKKPKEYLLLEELAAASSC